MTKKTRRFRELCACGLLAGSGAAHAAVYNLPPPGEDWLGTPTHVKAQYRDSLASIAYRYGLGFRQVIHANPGVAPWAPDSKRPVLLPTAFLLPQAPRVGIVVNVPEMRLYYFPENGTQVYVYPIAVGRIDWKTPLGQTQVRYKMRNPSWHPTPSIIAEHAANGDPVEPIVPPGPDNPLGDFALRLGWKDVLIHGTNKPMGGIGMPVTHGCVRLYPKDIAELYNMVTPGTPVNFIDQPYKFGHHAGRWYVEAHAVLTEDPQAPVSATDVAPALMNLKTSFETPDAQIGADGAPASQPDWQLVEKAIRQSNGMPLLVDTPARSAKAADSAHPLLTRLPNAPEGAPGNRAPGATSG